MSMHTLIRIFFLTSFTGVALAGIRANRPLILVTALLQIALLTKIP